MRKHLHVRRWSYAALVSVTLLVASACAGGGSGDSDKVTLGLLAPIAGSFSDVGNNLRQGAKIAIDEVNADGGVLDGKKLELAVKDTSKGPQQAGQAVRDFIGDDQPLLLGELSSANCLAESPLVDKLGGVFVITTCTNMKLTGESGRQAPYERTFRVGATDIADMNALYKVMKKEFPDVSGYDVFAFDYVSGHEEWNHYRDGLKKSGTKVSVGKEFWVPLDAQNYRSQVSALAASAKGAKDRGLYLGTYGSGTSAFLKQAKPFGLVDEYRFVVNPGDYYTIGRELGEDAPTIWNGYDYHYDAYDTDANKAFVSAFEKQTGKKPATWSYQAYLAVRAYAAAIDKAGSDEPEKVAEALRGISFDSPQGKYAIDPKTQQGSANIVITKTVGDKDAPEGLKLLRKTVVTAKETTSG